MIQITDYIDYRTGQCLPQANTFELSKLCEDYSSDILDSLCKSFGGNNTYSQISIDTNFKPSAWYGSQDIIDIIDKEILLTRRCENINIQLTKLKELISGLFALNPDMEKKKVDDLLYEINKCLSDIEYFHHNICNSCIDKECSAAIDEIIRKRPYRSDILGVASGNEITLFSSAISQYSDSAEEYNSRFLATLAHETFHVYHYYRCTSNWNNDTRPVKQDEEFLDVALNGSSNVIGEQFKNVISGGFTRERPHYDNIVEKIHSDMRDLLPVGLRIPQYITTGEIVKESLASYFEYYSGIYGCNFTNPSEPAVSKGLRSSWAASSPTEWPYSGARAFIPDEDRIAAKGGNFRIVLDISSYDWNAAANFILSEYPKYE